MEQDAIIKLCIGECMAVGLMVAFRVFYEWCEMLAGCGVAVMEKKTKMIMRAEYVLFGSDD